MKPLLDADVLRYEIGFASETGWKSMGKEGLPPFDYVANLLDERINNICAMVGATVPPSLYLTGKGNLRNAIAKRVPYKTRPSVKPHHFNNLTAYIKVKYDPIISDGMEADDLMAIEQTRVEGLLGGNPFYSGPSVRTIICSRDKDLRTVAGWNYGWELANQPSFGPEYITDEGYIRLSDDRRKIIGTGLAFFYSQCLTGDKVDSIPGIEGLGPVKAFNILDGYTSMDDAYKRVLGAYMAAYGDRAEEELLEQGRLLWMTRELDKEGKPILWELPVIQDTQTDVATEPLLKGAKIAHSEN